MGFYRMLNSFLESSPLHAIKGPIMALPLPIIAGVVFWLVRRARHKKRFGERFGEVRRDRRVNELIRAFFVVWIIYTAVLTLVPVKIEIIVMTYIRNGEMSGASIPVFMFGKEHILSSVSHFFGSISAEEIFSLHFIMNLLFFVPFGFCLPCFMKRESLPKVVLAGAAVSLTIEFLQIFILRESELADLISNTLGVLAGYLIFMLIKKKFPVFHAKCVYNT